MSQHRRTLAELNALGREEFVRVVGPVFEHSPWIAEAAWAARPFASAAALHQALGETVSRAGAERQLSLIRAHPDLVGRAALAGTLTPPSAREQATAGLGQLTPAEIDLFQRYNREYRERFGFPFVICARMNKKETILAAFPIRLRHTSAQEIQTALAEIAHIARLRLDDLLAAPDAAPASPVEPGNEATT